MSDPEPDVAPDQGPDARREAPWRGWLLTGVEVAVGLVLTIAWIVFLVWIVARLV